MQGTNTQCNIEICPSSFIFEQSCETKMHVCCYISFSWINMGHIHLIKLIPLNCIFSCSIYLHQQLVYTTHYLNNVMHKKLYFLL